MKQFTSKVKSARQGEIYFIRIDKLPASAIPVKPEDGKFIVAHSETGHHHVIEARPNVKYYSTDNPLVSYLQVVEATDATEAILKHLRTFDTHEPISFHEGIYCAVTGRESAPEGWRKVQD